MEIQVTIIPKRATYRAVSVHDPRSAVCGVETVVRAKLHRPRRCLSHRSKIAPKRMRRWRAHETIGEALHNAQLDMLLFGNAVIG